VCWSPYLNQRRWINHEVFPDWPGFLPQREQATWRQTFVEQRAKLLGDMQALDERYSRRRPEINV
jgi:hypothetical protein